MKLFVGFLTYNEASTKYLATFLDSLEKALSLLKRSDYKVVDFDNSDPSYSENQSIISEFNNSHDDLIEYLTINKNLGFGRAFNILINKAKLLDAEYFLILNPDLILEPDSIKLLVSTLDKNINISAVSPKIYYWDFLHNQKTKKIDSLGLVLRPGLRFYDLGQGQEDQGQFDNFNIIGPSGAAGMLRMRDLEKIALLDEDNRMQFFDERFFMYKEDCDLSYRLYLSKLKSEISPNSIMYHDRTSGSGRQGFFQKILNRSQKSRQIRAWSLRNQNIIYAKYWKNQNFVNKILIIFWFLTSFIFSLIFEQFNLKLYFIRNKD